MRWELEISKIIATNSFLEEYKGDAVIQLDLKRIFIQFNPLLNPS